MTPEEMWRRKSDEDLLAASTRLTEYTESGQRIILAEIRRRDLALTTVVSTDRVGSVDTELGAVTAGVNPKRQAYVVRLWRGEVSLPVTYWVWGVLCNGLARVLILMVLLLTNASLVLARTAAVLYLAYSVFIIVAIWRSSSRYAGPRIWKDLARLSLALLLIFRLVDRLLRLTD